MISRDDHHHGSKDVDATEQGLEIILTGSGASIVVPEQFFDENQPTFVSHGFAIDSNISCGTENEGKFDKVLRRKYAVLCVLGLLTFVLAIGLGVGQRKQKKPFKDDTSATSTTTDDDTTHDDFNKSNLRPSASPSWYSSSPSSSPSLYPVIWQQVGSSINGIYHYQFMGKSVSLSYDGSRLAVAGTDQIHLFHQRMDGEWMLSYDLSKQIPKGMGELKVDLSPQGKYLAVSAPVSDNLNSNSINGGGVNCGEVRVFQRSTKNSQWTFDEWVQAGNTLHGVAAYDYFGSSLTWSSENDEKDKDTSLTLAIGASGGNYVQVYKIQSNPQFSTQILPMGKALKAPVEQSNTHIGFGHDISISENGSLLAIGAPWAGRERDSDTNPKGSVYIYDISWMDETPAQLTAQFNGRSSNDWFGWAVSMSSNGTKLAVGAPENANGGYVAIFEKYAPGNTDWKLMGSMISSSSSSSSSNDVYTTSKREDLGAFVSLSGDGRMVAIGTMCDPSSSLIGEQKERIQILTFQSNAWVPMKSEFDLSTNDKPKGNNVLYSKNSDKGGACSMSVSLSGDGTRMALGSIMDDTGETTRGHVKVFANQSSG